MSIDKNKLKNDILEFSKLSQQEQKNNQKIKYSSDLIDECYELNPENIIPKIIPVDSKSDLWKVWKAVEQNVASFEFRRSAGRNSYFLVVNEYDNKVLGVLDVGADFLSLGERDKYIGWDKEERKRYNRNIANISICVPTRHFGYNLCGGKLLALIATSQEVANHWENKYGDKLAGLTVTSLYGRGSQYNRLKQFKYVGKTKGQGTCQITDDLYRRCRDFVESIDGEIPSGRFTKGKNSRINIIRRACKYLNIDAKILTTHGRQRGIYWCDRANNTKEYLCGKTDSLQEYGFTIKELTTYWRENWAYRRLKNLHIDI